MHEQYRTTIQRSNMARKHRNGLKPVMVEPHVVNGRREGKGREEGRFGGVDQSERRCLRESMGRKTANEGS